MEINKIIGVVLIILSIMFGFQPANAGVEVGSITLLVYEFQILSWLVVGTILLNKK